MSSERHIVVTESDLLRLSRLVSGATTRRDGRACAALEEELSRADVVTMNSRARFVDEASGEEMELTLVYPREADIASRRVSVLAPVGAALLGLAVGQAIEWPLPAGGARRLRVTEVVYQPEAAGDLHL